MKVFGQQINKFLLIVLVLGAILRLIALENYPIGFTPDEASFGYDAYSLLLTGKDQWGHRFPIVLESFGDFKAPLFSYLLIPFVAAGGLEKSVVRLPNALAGTLAIVVVYYLVKELFSLKDKEGTKRANFVAGASALLLAISPWHVMMSRGAFEANLTTLFLPLGLLLLLKGFKKYIYLYLGALVLGLNLFTYHSAKVVTPLVVLTFIYLFWEKISQIRMKSLLIAAGILASFLLITAYSFSAGAGARVSDVSIFRGITEASAESKAGAFNLGINPLIARVLYSKYAIPVSRFLENYVTYFSPQFLFTKGPAEATYGMIPGRGVLYWFELPLLIGFLASLFKAKDKRLHLLFIGWLLVSPIPAALTTGPGYAANRAEAMLPAFQIILALGALEVFSYLKEKLSRARLKWALIAYGVFSFVLFIGFLSDYFIVSPTKNAQAMLYGNLEVARFLKEEVPEGSEIIVSRGLSEPQIYISFVNKWDPTSYQKATQSWDYKERGIGWVDQIPEYRLGNYTFKAINIDDYKEPREGFTVGRPTEFPNDVAPFKTIYYLGNKPAIYVFDLSITDFGNR